MTDESEAPAPDQSPATVAAKKAQLVALAQYVVAVDGTKVVEGEARNSFALTQTIAAKILTETLSEYPIAKPA